MKKYVLFPIEVCIVSNYQLNNYDLEFQVTYIIDNAVEEECRGSTWAPGKVWTYCQDEKVSSHTLPSDSNSLTFMGRLAQELMRITDPK